jgi:hypothetical protein
MEKLNEFCPFLKFSRTASELTVAAIAEQEKHKTVKYAHNNLLNLFISIYCISFINFSMIKKHKLSLPPQGARWVGS